MTDAPTIDLAEIKRLAEAAQTAVEAFHNAPRDELPSMHLVEHTAARRATDRLHARLSAATVLALLSRLAAAEQERDRLRVVAEAASKMRDATEEYVRQAELDPPECSFEAEQAARKAELLATIALDEALAALRASEPKE